MVHKRSYRGTKKNPSGYDGRCADVWSLGIVLFVSFTGVFFWDIRRGEHADPSYPKYKIWFHDGTDNAKFGKKMKQWIQTGQVLNTTKSGFGLFFLFFSFKILISFLGLDLILKILHPIPENRFTTEEILSHPFLTEKKIKWL